MWISPLVGEHARFFSWNLNNLGFLRSHSISTPYSFYICISSVWTAGTVKFILKTYKTFVVVRVVAVLFSESVVGPNEPLPYPPLAHPLPSMKIMSCVLAGILFWTYLRKFCEKGKYWLALLFPFLDH